MQSQEHPSTVVGFSPLQGEASLVIAAPGGHGDAKVTPISGDYSSRPMVEEED